MLINAVSVDLILIPVHNVLTLQENNQGTVNVNLENMLLILKLLTLAVLILVPGRIVKFVLKIQEVALNVMIKQIWIYLIIASVRQDNM